MNNLFSYFFIDNPSKICHLVIIYYCILEWYGLKGKEKGVEKKKLKKSVLYNTCRGLKQNKW